MMGVADSQAKGDTWTVGGKITLKKVELIRTTNPDGAFEDVTTWDKASYEYYTSGKFRIGDPGGRDRVWVIGSIYGDRGWVVKSFSELGK